MRIWVREARMGGAPFKVRRVRGAAASTAGRLLISGTGFKVLSIGRYEILVVGFLSRFV